MPIRGAWLLVVALSLAACRAPTAPDSEVGTSGSVPDMAAAIIDPANAERVRAGLRALRTDGRLIRAAQIHAEQIAAVGRLEHTLPDARYPTLADRMAAAGYEWHAIGENLAAGQPTPAQAVASWMTSAAHRANILNTRFTETGAAVAVDATRRPWYVQVFGAR